MDIEITEEQQGALSWLRAQVAQGFDNILCVTTDYAEKSPVYIGSNLQAIIDMACEDYADWDEGSPV